MRSSLWIIATALALPLSPLTESALAEPTLITLASFSVNNANAVGGLTIDPQGNLYGMTLTQLYEIAAGTQTLTILAPPAGGVSAATVASPTLDASGNLFGPGGSGIAGNDNGGIFEYNKTANSFTTIASFMGYNGVTPAGSLTLYKGDFYGVTSQGGGHGYGTVYKLDGVTHAITTIASFSSTTGNYPWGNLAIDAHGNIFGTTRGPDSGTVFEIAAGTNKITTLANLGGAYGTNPIGGLTIDAYGNLFGTSSEGGTNNDGAIFELAAGNTTLKTVATFNGDNGSSPYATVTIDSHGNIFGTTGNGGAYDDGTIFEVAVGSNTITTLHSFNSADGSEPRSALVMDSHGNPYGTTRFGGASGYGSVFELTGLAAVPEPGSIVTLSQGISLALAGLASATYRRRATPRRETAGV